MTGLSSFGVLTMGKVYDMTCNKSLRGFSAPVARIATQNSMDWAFNCSRMGSSSGFVEVSMLEKKV